MSRKHIIVAESTSAAGNEMRERDASELVVEQTANNLFTISYSVSGKEDERYSE